MRQATLYLNDKIHQVLRAKANVWEGLEDLQVWRERREGPRMGYEDFVKQLET